MHLILHFWRKKSESETWAGKSSPKEMHANAVHWKTRSMWLQRNQGNTRAEINNAILCFFYINNSTQDCRHPHCCVGILSVSVMLSNTATEVCNEMNFIPFNDGMFWKLVHLKHIWSAFEEHLKRIWNAFEVHLKCIWSTRNENPSDMRVLRFHFMCGYFKDLKSAGIQLMFAHTGCFLTGTPLKN